MLFYLNFLALLILLLPLNVITNEEVQYIKLEILRRLSCSLGLTNKNCAVDGGWSFWSFWGPCVGACGQVGLRWRTRECNSPKPANNGLPCVGNYHECKECRKEACSLEDYREFIKCDLIRSKEFELIEEIDKKYSSLTTKCLQSECHYKTAHNILQDDTDLYWNALHCVKHNIGCPEYGGWSNWGDWTDCSSHCGYGKQITCRSCDHPRPTNPKYKCTGNNCTTISCMGTKCDSIDGSWSSWSHWSECSVSCGQGFSKRIRSCSKEEVKKNRRPSGYRKYIPFLNKCPKNSSLAQRIRKRRDIIKQALINNSITIKAKDSCKGPYKQLKPCYLNDCPVDGGWSEWEPWSQCSADCGLGTQSRNRACSSPPFSNGGRACIGPVTHIRHCFLRPCRHVPHELAVFLGEASLSYYKTGTSISLLHIYIKFKTSENSGYLIRRESLIENKHTNNYVRLYLEAGYIVLSVRHNKCRLTIISQKSIEHEKWTEVLIMITPSEATMRIDNSNMYHKKKFNCALKRPNFDSEMIVGYNLKGEIEKLVINFKERNLGSGTDVQNRVIAESNNISPFLVTNVDYTENDRDDGLYTLENLIYAPCTKNKKSWTIEMVIKTQASEGAVLLIKDYYLSKYLLLMFEPHRIALRLLFGDCITETDQIVEAHQNIWSYIVIDYNETNAIGLRLNGGKRKRLNSCLDGQELSCKDNIYIGDIDHLCKNTQLPNNSFISYAKSMTGILALLKIDGVEIDLESLPIQSTRGDRPFTSATISYSNNYMELHLPYGEQLNLSCLYCLDLNTDDLLPRLHWNRSKPFWLKFDTPIDIQSTDSNSSNIIFDIYEDNRLYQLRTLHYSSREDIEGFYSCWLPNPKRANNSNILFTYGITLQTYAEFKSFSTNLIMIAQIMFIIMLPLFCIWLIYEYYNDSKKGWGIFTPSKTVEIENIFILNHTKQHQNIKK